MKAEVKLACGRLYVNLGGLVIAMETDACREPRISSNTYDSESLHQLADLINERLNGPEVAVARRWSLARFFCFVFGCVDAQCNPAPHRDVCSSCGRQQYFGRMEH